MSTTSSTSNTEHPTSFGVFKPVGHVVISFPSADQAQAARAAIEQTGLPPGDVHFYTARAMLQQIEHDLACASSIAAIGQELNLIKAHQALAERGYHWLVVKAKGTDHAREIADLVKPLGAERAQLYGRFIIEEMIEHEGDMPQVAESPDRGLDAQTPSGNERERAAMRPAEPALAKTGDR
ncbi:hypothetical protein LRH25_03055 [Ideonella azotifigens]|uniref:Uncharacterized protein n=1 Tax=Ideonella azotifigens TaxID=513160 RepID=A0ABP3VTR3_9BURK|nr:hypothetical protein [Ideonella azotifigens]MCD2339313.1 hypothetical protein [Ideonella azotifigens]